MGTHRRNNGRTYSYRSVRRGDRIDKIFLGNGPLAEFAERLGVLRRHENDRVRQLWSADVERIEALCGQFEELDTACDVMRDAVLLVLDFYTHHRHRWLKRRRKLRVFHPEDVR